MLVSEIKVLSASDISSALDRTVEVYDVPEWGGAIKLRPLSLAQRDELTAQSTVNGQTDGQKIVRLLVVYGVAEPVMTEALLQDKAFAVVDRIAKRIMALNGMGTEQEAGLTASRTFRPESGPGVPVSARKGSR